MLELKHLKTIVAIQEHGSLPLAADKLRLTQSALSHQIKDIESRLGVSLFIRKSRPLRLTQPESACSKPPVRCYQ